MTQRKAFLTKEQSLLLRGIAIFLVLICHYAVWIGEIFHSDLLEYGLGRFGVYGVDLFFVVSGYGLVNAVTHYSQALDDYDRATEFEALGGKLIELPAQEWRQLAEAA